MSFRVRQLAGGGIPHKRSLHALCLVGMTEWIEPSLYFCYIDFMNPSPAPPELNVPPPPQSLPSFQKRMMMFGLVALVFISVLVIVLLYARGQSHVTVLDKPEKPFIPSPTAVSPKSKGLQVAKQWVDCSDLRDVIENDDTLYVACMGGVLIYNQDKGQVTGQISMTDGLGNNTVTNIQKSGNTLYIGTQDGFTIYNLVSKTGKKVSVTEGLVNGANIYLALDGERLWVGTFKGLSSYNTKNGAITNYGKELADNATEFEVNRILVTDKGVYFTVGANAYSQGGLARFDKGTSQWERFGYGSFYSEPTQYPRIDIMGIAQTRGMVYVTGSDGKIWTAEDKAGTQWKRLDKVEAQLKKDATSVFPQLFATSRQLYVVNDGRLYEYKVDEESLQLRYPTFMEGPNVLSDMTYTNLFHFVDKLYFRLPFGSTGWLRWFDPQNSQTGLMKLNNRPAEFQNVLAIIDDIPFICADGTVWKGREFAEGFDQYSDIPCNSQNGGNFAFRPITGTNKVFSFGQECGQACGKPSIKIIDYDDPETVKTITIPQEIMDKIHIADQGDWGYSSLNTQGYDNRTSTITFTYYASSKNEEVTYNAARNTWTTPRQTDRPASQMPDASFCNPSYTFASTNESFSAITCTLPLSDGSFVYSVERSSDQNEVQQTKLVKESVKTHEKTYLDVPAGAPLPYSPFGPTFNRRSIRSLSLVDSKLFVGTATGISLFDLKTNKWKTFTTTDGLVSNDIDSFAVGDKSLWVVSHWGGLSVLPL